MRSLRKFREWCANQRIDIFDVRLDGCQYGLKCQKGMLLKPWKILTNCSQFRSLSRVCSKEHRASIKHVPILGAGLTASAAEYPPRMVDAIVDLWLKFCAV